MEKSCEMQMPDMRVTEVNRISAAYALIKLTPVKDALPCGIQPGQFVQIEIPKSKSTFLRRPISICMADCGSNEIWLLVRNAGKGTETLIASAVGDIYNVVLPLGHGFSVPKEEGILLVGGGVGVAPLLYYGKKLWEKGLKPVFALGARSASDLLLIDEFSKYGPVHVSTEDGSAGEKGLITTNSVFNTNFKRIACCGPTPMMKAVAKIAAGRGIDCEVSLENVMACGLGACLCCVEDTKDGNVCVCKNGPVFNINQLKWQI
ncbi:MAG: dihydroorotate dehydrogenase electron transfer subunit [Clostridium sp.]|nr:dihydroorotate dehydrogenase electron transfer subunit [Clostridium sp.]